MGQEAHDRAQQAGFNHHFDPAKPWAWVSGEQCMEVLGFWHREVTEPCMLYLAKTTNLNALVEDDCLTRPREIITTSTRSMPAQTSQPSQPSRPTKRARGPDIREHRAVEDGSFTRNEPCRLFQTGGRTEKYSRRKLRQKQQSPTSVLKVPDRKTRCQQMPIRWTKAASSQPRSQGPR